MARFLSLIFLFFIVGCSTNKQVERIYSDMDKSKKGKKQTYNSVVKAKYMQDTVFKQTQSKNYLQYVGSDTNLGYYFLSIENDGDFIAYYKDTVYRFDHGYFFYSAYNSNKMSMVEGLNNYKSIYKNILGSYDVKDFTWIKKKEPNEEMEYEGIYNSYPNFSISLWKENNKVSKIRTHFFGDTWSNTEILKISKMQYYFNDSVWKILDKPKYDINNLPSDFFDSNSELKVPDLHIPDLDGKNVHLLGSNKEYIALDFFFMACSPCIKAIPHIKKMAKKYNNEIDFYAIDPIDTLDIEKLKVFKKRHEIPYPVLIGNDSITTALNIQMYPSLVIIKDGVVVKTFIGFDDSTAIRMDAYFSDFIGKNK